jgi:hypothetical protein
MRKLRLRRKFPHKVSQQISNRAGTRPRASEDQHSALSIIPTVEIYLLLTPKLVGEL